MRAFFGEVSWSLVAILALVAPAMAEIRSLSGQVTYRERVALPPGAALRIMLVDLSDPAQHAHVDVRAPVGSPGQVPLTFALNFDDQALTPGRRYGIVAEILAGDRIWFHTAEPYGLDPLAPPASLVIVTTPAGHDEQTGSVEPIAASSASSAIIGGNWRAVEIRGAAVSPDVDSTLSIGADRRAGGRGGCNSYFVQAELRGARITFAEIAATRMACLSDVATTQETAFFEAIGATRAWRLADDGSLIFLDAEDTPLVRFMAVTR